MKVLITGATGQLGHDIVKFAPDIHTLLTPTRNEMDLSDTTSVKKYLSKNNPEYIIHCAAWTKVDDAESNVELCRKINVEGTRYLTDYCKIKDIPIIYISTDYVFNGKGIRPWTVNDSTDPINTYGLSKRDGENIVKTHSKHYIVRISWVFGPNGNNFVKTILNKSKISDKICVVDDQLGSPTYTTDIAPLIWEMVKYEKYGTYHAHNEGYCSWYEFAKKIIEAAKLNIDIIPICSDQYCTKAKRPRNGMMDTSSLINNGFKQLPEWGIAIDKFVTELNKYEGST